MDGVVPFAVECVGFDLASDHRHLSVADLDLAGVAVGVRLGMHRQPRSCSCRSNQLDHHLVAR